MGRIADCLTGLTVTGTDTGVGKTFVAASIVRQLVTAGRKPGVMKPLASGCHNTLGGLESDDTRFLGEALGHDVPLDRISPLRYAAPLAPSAAARQEGQPLDFAKIERAVSESLDWWVGRCDGLVVEGVGGLLCPIAEDATWADLAVWLGFPVLIVARAGLGTLNHTLLTLEAAGRRGLHVVGVILNAATPDVDPSHASNHAELARRVGIACPIATLCYTKDPARFDPALLRLLDPSTLVSPRSF